MLRTTSVTTRDTGALDEAVLRLRLGAVTWREIDGELVLLDLETSTYLNVNAAGTTLWPALEQGVSTAALVTALVDHFDVSPESAAQDVEAFVADIRGLGYLAD